MAVSGLSRDDIDLYDVYSCFPIVPKLAASHLGLSLEGHSDTRPITILGGLTSFGGAGNNYSMHVSIMTLQIGIIANRDKAITEMTRQLRQGKGKHGLVLANGGVVTYQYAVCLSSQPRRDGSPYPAKNPLPDIITTVPVPQVDNQPDGDAIIEVRKYLALKA